MSTQWDAVERHKSAVHPNSSEAGEFADRIGHFADEIGKQVGEVDGDFGESAADARFDELVDVLSKRVIRAVAVKQADDIVAAEKRKDVRIAAAAGDAVDGTSLEERLAQKYQRMMLEIYKAPLPKLEVRVTLMALGWAPESESMRECAAAYTLSAEQVSNMVEAKQAKHRLPQNHFNKSAQAKGVYQQTNGR